MTTEATTLSTAETHDPDAAARDYWAQARQRIALRWARQHEPDTVLDVGCGSGYMAAQLADDAQVLGIDPDPQAIDRARRRDINTEFEQATATDSPAGPYDLILAMDVIEHVEPERIWPALAKRLAPDGRLIVSVPALQRLYGIHDERQGHRCRFSIRTLREEAGHYGALRMVRHRHTNVLPLPIYLAIQKLGIEPPAGTRGGHARPIEWAKQAALALETRWPLPIGITLLAEFEHL